MSAGLREGDLVKTKGFGLRYRVAGLRHRPGREPLVVCTALDLAAAPHGDYYFPTDYLIRLDEVRP
jgi:hypothetical protein